MRKKNTNPPRPICQFHEFIEVSLSIGNSIEDIALKIGRNYKETLEYLQENGMLDKFKRRSWTHKTEKKKYKKTRKDPDAKRGSVNWPPRCKMFISFSTDVGRQYYNVPYSPGGLL